MRKLKLQMHMTMDGFVGRSNGDTDWMWLPGERDENGFLDIVKLAQSCDTLLLGRKMARGFIDHWENMADNEPDNPAQSLAQLIVNMRKIVFSKTETTISGRNLEVENGDLAAAVQELKNQPGKDILVYGGAHFVSSLVSLNLIDEYTLIVNPVAIGQGMSIFKGQKILNLLSSHAYKSGKIINKYVPV